MADVPYRSLVTRTNPATQTTLGDGVDLTRLEALKPALEALSQAKAPRGQVADLRRPNPYTDVPRYW